MPVEVRVPALGESVTEATVASWLKNEGDVVEAGEPLVELETDKVNMDVAAERSGVLAKIVRAAGETVQPGDVLATVDEGGAAGTSEAASVPADAQPAAASGAGAASSDGSAAVAASASASGSAPAAPSGPAAERPHASPVARRMADEHGLDLGQIAGSGTAGRVTREDVQQFLTSRTSQQPTDGASSTAPSGPARPSPAAAGRSPDARGEERVRMSRRRQTIALRLLEAQRTAAMLTTFNEVDMTAVMELRAARREAFQQRHGVGLGFMSFFTKASVAALKAFPNVNAEIQGDEIVRKKYYDIGVAVGVSEGLVVPIVRDADRKSFAEIEREIVQLAERARNNTLTLEDLRGGTFTITNGGIYGSLMSTPILSPPQVGILGMHAIKQRPIAVDGQVAIRPMMYVALSYDHRIVDGQEAVQFLIRIKSLIEDPTSLLLDG